MSMLVQQSGNVKPPQSILNGSTNDSCVEVQLLHEESQMYHSRWPTYPNCFGLPYQDHNYGAPPPPTPPASPPAIVKVNGHLDIDVSCNTVVVTTPTILPTQLPTPTAANTDDSVTRCICDFQHDDGYMICCDECGVWQHVDCMGVDRGNIPEIYHCDRCQPRKLDKQRAVQLQRKRRALLRKLDSSATETEDETKHNGVLQQKKVKKKKKKSRKENKDGVPGMGSRAQWGGNRKHSPPSAHHPQMKFGRKVQPQHNGAVSGGIQNKPKKFDQNRHAIKKLNKAKMPKITSKSLNMSCEDTHGPWDIGLLDSYEEAKGNQYSIDIKSLLANQPLNGQHMNSASGASTKQLQLPDQLCRVAQVSPNHKGLEVLDSVRSNQPLIEYKGKVMLREQYDKENIFFKRLHPFVLFSKFEGLQLCVDASVYANDARYVRRSCMPNAQVQHVLENDRVHFYIFASKHIAKGSEVTIPFDFNYEECCYGVECACTKISCPVLRLQKKVSDGHAVAKPARRRKRFSSSSGTDNGINGGPTTPQTPQAPLPHRNNSNDDDIDRLMTLSTVAAAAATVATPTTKRRKLAPLRISDTVNKQDEEEVKKEVISPVDTKPPEQPPPAPPPTPTSAPINSPPLPVAPASEVVKSPVKTEQATEGPGGDNEDPADNAETDHTQAEKDHKMTREERKMEAILKAFERLEKREERRKEALARIEHSRKSKEAHLAETPTTDTKEAQLQGKDTDSDNKPEKVKPKGKKRRPSGTPARRRNRPSSSVSTATESATSADEGSSLPPSTPMEHSPGSSTPSSAAVFDHTFKFPKTKKHLMSEWLSENENAASRLVSHTKMEPLEINTTTGGDAAVEFVKCIPSPQAHSFSRLRRSSMSAGVLKGPTGASGGAGLQLDCSIGSAKKRWLRQAMSENSDCDATSTPTSGCDTTGTGCDMANSGYMSPLSCSRGGTDGASPNPCADGAASPGASPPVDFVTPLKKRRLARESLESPFPFASAAAPAAIPTAALGDSHAVNSRNMSEIEKGSCEAAPLPTEHNFGDNVSPFRDGCQPSHVSSEVSSGDNLFEKFGVPTQQRAAVVAPPDSPTVNRLPERFPTPEPSDQSDSPISAVQYTNADSTEVTSVTVTRPWSTPSQSTPDSVDNGAVVASTVTAALCQGSTSSRSNGVETSTDMVDPCTSCSEVDTKCTSTEPTVSSRNSGDYAVSTAAVPSLCHSECDSTAAAASRDSVTAATSCSSTSRDVGEGAGRTVCVGGVQATHNRDSNCCMAISDSRTCVTANVDVVVIVTTAMGGCIVTDSQAAVSIACSQNDSVGTSSTTVSCGAPLVAAESSSGTDCALRTAVASCSSCNNNSPVLDGCVDTAPVESGSSGVAEAPSSTPQQCSVIDSGGDGDLHSSIVTADSSLEESQRHTYRTDNSQVACSVFEQPTISCSGTRDNNEVGGSSEAGQAGDNPSDDLEIEKEEGEITDDDDACGSVTGTAEEESRAIVNSICRRARELREAEISSSRHYYVKRSRSQSIFNDGHVDSSSVSGTSSTPTLVHGDAHHRDSQSPTHPPYRWDSPVDSTSPNQHFDLSQTVNSDATSSTQGDSYRDSYVDNPRSPASSSGDASNSSFFSSCGASEASGPSSTCTFFGMDLPTKKKVSLSEYRKRIKQQKVPPRGVSSNGSSSHRTSSPSIGRDSSVQPRLAPFPMFNAFRSPELGNGLLSPPLPPPPPPSEPYPDSEETVSAGAQWSTSSTAAVEKMREQTTSLSLTERLRREFGLDTTSESDEDTNDKAGRRQKEGAPGRDSPSMPPPPPPPPPPPAANCGFAAPLAVYPPAACVSDRSLVAGPHQTSPVLPPPPPPPQIHAAPYYHHPAPVTMAMPPCVTTTLPPQHLQSMYPTAINVSYGYTTLPVNGQVAPLNSQVTTPINSQVAPPNSQVAAPLQQHMAYNSDSRQHAPPVVTGPVQQIAAPPQAALMPQATGQLMAPVVTIQHMVPQVAPPSHPSVTQQAAPIPHPGVAAAPQPTMSYPLDPRLQYVRAEQAPVAPSMALTPAVSYPMQQPPQQPLLPTPATVAAPQRPPPGPPARPPRSIPSLMSLPSFPTKTFSSSLLTGVDHGSSSSSSSSSGSGSMTPQSNTHPGYTQPSHSSSSSSHPSPGPPSQNGFSQ